MQEYLKDNPVRMYRKEHGLSRSDLCRLVNISYTTLGNIEQGIVLKISDDVRKELLDAGFPESIDLDYLEWKAAMEESLGKKADMTYNLIERRKQAANE